MFQFILKEFTVLKLFTLLCICYSLIVNLCYCNLTIAVNIKERKNLKYYFYNKNISIYCSTNISMH